MVDTHDTAAVAGRHATTPHGALCPSALLSRRNSALTTWVAGWAEKHADRPEFRARHRSGHGVAVTSRATENSDVLPSSSVAVAVMRSPSSTRQAGNSALNSSVFALPIWRVMNPR